MGARYYNPLTGRFLSIDPKEADPSDLHSLNRYAYGNNNPYRYVDPDGHTPVDLAFFAVDAVRLGVALYSGGDVGGAALDLGLSAIGVLSPVPGAGQALKAVRVADKAVDGARAADNALAVGAGAAKGAGTAFKDFNQARNGAVQWLEGRGFKAEQATLGKFGDSAGKPIGMKSADGKSGFRVEFDERHGAHLNVWSGRQKETFTFEGSQPMVNQIVKQFVKERP